MLRLVPHWKRAWRWFSIHALVISGIIPMVWANLPGDMRASVPPDTLGVITGVVATLGVIGRLFQQPKKEDENVDNHSRSPE